MSASTKVLLSGIPDSVKARSPVRDQQVSGLSKTLSKLGVTVTTVDQRNNAHVVEPTDAHIIGPVEPRGSQPSYDDVKLLSLPHCRFTAIGHRLPLCSMIRVLDLSSNFLRDITPLAGCIRLVKLDLHNNHILELPTAAFWKRLRYLRVLHLHGNSIGGRQSLQASVESLKSCPRLQILTLHDTPLSLSRGYRHHVVNLIWSLRALDHHVIADSEIIEGAKFPGRFSPMSQELACPLHWRTEQSLWSELARIFMFLFEVRRIQSKHSPIQTIQRFWRNVLDSRRRKVNKVHTEVPAAIGRLVSNSATVMEARHSLSGVPYDMTVRGDGTERRGSWFDDEEDESEAPTPDSTRSPQPGTAAAAAAQIPTGDPNSPGSPDGDAARAPGAPLPTPTTVTSPQSPIVVPPPGNLPDDDPIFTVDRMKLLSTLQKTLQTHGPHQDVAGIDWSVQLPSESLAREAQNEYLKLQATGGTIKFPNLMRLTAADAPFTAESLLRIADEIVQPLQHTSLVRGPAVIAAQAAAAAALGEKPQTPFSELLDTHKLVRSPAEGAETAREALARLGGAELEAGVRSPALATELPMRRKLYDPQHVGEELRRFHDVRKNVLASQGAADAKKKHAETAARRVGGTERLRAGFNRREDSQTVATFLSPLLANESSRQKSKSNAALARKKQAAVYKVQAMEGASLLSRRDHYDQKFEAAQEKQSEHNHMVIEATQRQRDRRADDNAEKRMHKQSRRARLDAIRAERSERQGTFSRYNAMSSSRRAEERQEVKIQRHQTAVQKITKQKAEATAARKEFLGWLELLRENKTLDRLAKRAAVWERAAAMKDLTREAHRIKVAKARGERLQLKPLEGGGNRDRLSWRGLRGTPANKKVVPMEMSSQLIQDPTHAMLKVDVADLSARAYPKQFWSGLPRALKHQALVEEFEERWKAIGSFCGNEICKLSPRNACASCFGKFRNFADNRLDSSHQ